MQKEPLMELTTAMLTAFIGGQVEIQNLAEGYIYHGEIETAVVENKELRLTLNWMAKGEGYPPLPNAWVADDNLDYAASLDIYSVNNIGPSGDEVGGGNRLFLSSEITGERVALYPADGSKLDPAKVRGLQVPAPNNR
jgi:hypothetical protein